VVRPQAAYAALQAARQRQATATFQTQYAARAGIEGTLSQGVRVGDVGRARYLGLAKTIPSEYPCRPDRTCRS
jgi:transposase